jgi:hypothetical protein
VAKTWVLDTATKGTGASVRPLKRADGGAPKPPSGNVPFVPPKRAPKTPPAPAPRQPRKFRVVDVVTREVLAEDADLRATLQVLSNVRSTVDVHVSVFDTKNDRWRLLSIAEQRALWEARTAARPPRPVPPATVDPV